MIPIMLKLRNFMCYGDGEFCQELRFDGMQVACIAGDNGHGKSALLDAITWALWGCSRADYSGKDLMRQGCSEMEVEFQFQLGAERYGVVRKLALKGRTPSTSLSLAMETGNGWRVLAGDGVNATQSAILNLLRMSYDTFVRSALVLQGQADLFAVEDPAKKKEVLAEVLDLKQYDALEARAKELRDCYAQKVQSIQSSIGEREKELEEEPAIRQALVEAHERLVLARAELHRAEAEERAASQRLQGLEEQERQLQAAQKRYAELTGLLPGQEEAVANLRRKLEEARARVAAADEIEQGYARLLQARGEVRRLNELQARANAIELLIASATAKIAEEHAVLRARIDADEKLLGALHQEADERGKHEAALAQARAALERAEAAQAELEQRRDGQMERAKRLAELEAANRELTPQAERLKERMELLRSAGALCPVCAQPLDEPTRARVAGEQQAELEELREQYRQNEREIRALKATIAEEEPRLKALAREADAGRAQGAIARAEAAIKNCEQAEAKARELAERVAGLRADLESERFAAEARAELAAAQSALAGLGYDPAALQAAHQQESEYQRFEGEKALLDAARHDLPALERDLANAECILAGLREGAQEASRQVELLARAVDDLPAARASQRSARQALDLARQAEREADRAVVELEGRLNFLTVRRGEIADLIRQRDEAEHERSLYADLVQACGKRGVQARIIASVVPELEEEAGRLLGRLTDGRLQLRFKLTREKADGDIISAFEIEAGDGMGFRPYKLFSGGEAFRINFALRVALAKLLARRAGARLETLVIDEGFGSLDAEGRERLVEAIQAVSDEFALILVITHIPELRDAFPVRIDVVKTNLGSTIAIS